MVFEIIFAVMPKAFVLEMSSSMITGKKAEELKKVLELEGFRGYSISYHVVKESMFSGFPIVGSQAYMIGIRNDLYNDDFYFPRTDYIERSMFRESVEIVDKWYRRTSFETNIELQKGKFYVREGKKFYETDLIHLGMYREMYLVDSRGLRKFTHNECAFLKGLQGYDFNKCNNKREMYMRIAYASNVYVVSAIADALREFLAHLTFTTVKVNDIASGSKKKDKKKKIEKKNVPNDIIYPKRVLKSIHIDNLKGIKNLDISFEKNLTAIMGVNGAGKSTILHALACIYKPYKNEEDYKFPFFFTPNPDSSWENSKFSIKYWDENSQKEYTREYRKDTGRWSPRYVDRPQRDTYFIGIETCVPEIEKERQTSFIDYKTSLANERNADKIIKSAASILNKNYDQLNYHRTKKKELLGVHTNDDMKYSSLSMGAGEQRILRILKTIYTASEYSLILIDEVDILLHVTALKRLISKLSEVAVQRNLQIIFTTHSMEMDRLQDIVDIRYLHPLKEKTMVYNMITPDIVYELCENIEQTIKIYVEDLLAETIVDVVAGDLGISRNVKIVKIGAAKNAFVLAASFILQGGDFRNNYILLDGDVYRDESEKRKEIKKVLTGTEKTHNDKVDKAVKLIHQLNLPEKTEPEKFIFDMLIELEKQSELVRLAKRINAVSNSHHWLDKLVERMGKSKELVLYKIVDLVSEHEKWETYVSEIRNYLISCKENLQL